MNLGQVYEFAVLHLYFVHDLFNLSSVFDVDPVSDVVGVDQVLFHNGIDLWLDQSPNWFWLYRCWLNCKRSIWLVEYNFWKRPCELHLGRQGLQFLLRLEEGSDFGLLLQFLEPWLVFLMPVLLPHIHR